MAVKFSQFLAEALSSPSFLVGYNSTTNLNVRVSYADLVAAFTPGTGTVNYVAKWTGTSVLGNSQIFDNGTSVGIGTATPSASYKLDLTGAFRSTLDANINGITVGEGGGSIATNTAFGVSALAVNTTGVRNTVIGSNAGAANITSSDLTFVGANAGQSATGQSNTAIGADAANRLTSGASNLFVGRSSGYATTTGSQNVYVGMQSGYDVTTASNNTIIGYNTGRGITTGQQNTILGSNITGLSATLANHTIIADGNGNMRLVAFNDGNVYIGGSTTIPTNGGQKLQVVGGDAIINGLTVGKGGGQLATNTAVGFEALNATNTGGFNVAIGYRALKAYTGDSNVAIGTSALTANTTGNTNVGIGSGAGQTITTANKNTLVGYAAGSSNISSHGNTYIGYAAGISATSNSNTLIGSEAGYNMSTASQNTFVGNSAGRAVTSGGANTLIGYFSGYSLSTGSENVLIGNNIMAASSTASQNTIVGAFAGNVLTGNGNVYMGWYAGVSATTSATNTGIGYGALQSITTGGNNTAIGYRAGRFFGASTSSNTTGTQGIFIGYETRASADGNTNETVIGYNVVGNGSNSVTLGNTSVTKTILQGNVLIGTTTDAGYKLDVNGSFRAGNIYSTIALNTGAIILTLPTGGTSYYANGFTFVSSGSSTNRTWFAYDGSNNMTVRQYAGNFVYSFDNSSDHFRIQGASVSIGTVSPNASAQLDINSTTKGFLPPRMTNAQMVAITTPAAGLVVYDTTNNKLSVYDGATWIAVH
jgi:hypothetical protein